MLHGLLLAVVGTASVVQGHTYKQVEWWQGDNFFDGWNFFTDSDPTQGYVNYVDYNTALSKGYISTGDSNVYIGADHTNVVSGRGRDSVRISTKSSFSEGLFILQMTHMPVGCGTWPEWWSYGGNWPYGGDIDIVQGVNMQTNNIYGAHTSQGCDLSKQPANYTGNYVTGDCWAGDPDQEHNQGCTIASETSKSYGDGFNTNGGGVFATELNDDVGIRIWFWPMGSEPSDLTDNPDPDYWGTPQAAWPFGSWCTSNHFAPQNLILDLTFCGEWAGKDFNDQCSWTNATDCNGYVQNNPSAFENAYWKVDFVGIYQKT